MGLRVVDLGFDPGFVAGRVSMMDSRGKKRRPRRSFTPEFKSKIVGLAAEHMAGGARAKAQEQITE
ncbi:hypothetical protein GCM10009556_091880 [Acrocarpospora pleiomorpha]